MFWTLILVIVAQVYTNVKTHPVVHLESCTLWTNAKSQFKN